MAQRELQAALQCQHHQLRLASTALAARRARSLLSWLLTLSALQLLALPPLLLAQPLA